MTDANNYILEVKNLKVAFNLEGGILKAVDGVSFSLGGKETLGIVGESGCGKSVTALSILRLIPNPPGEILEGKIYWKGTDLLKIPFNKMPAIRGSQISMIFQEPMSSLNPVYTVGKQIGEVLRIRFGLKGEKAKPRIIELLDMVGISDPASRVNSYPHELSGGMMQRVMIAMALAGEPELLIADEPTTALDVTVQAQILRLIREMQERIGMSLILITHDMGVIAETCQQVAVMYAGRIVEKSDVENIFDHPRHPYTVGLLRSIPGRAAGRKSVLPTIEGTVPSLMHPPKGCRFAERCLRRKNRTEKEQDRCFEEDPRLQSLDENQWVACHFPMDVKQ